ncbi:MAG: Dabb family protein [Chthoniobacterales bacterium]|nr:Dabb family protein [Chthoniobacterales bacterium]
MTFPWFEKPPPSGEEPATSQLLETTPQPTPTPSPSSTQETTQPSPLPSPTPTPSSTSAPGEVIPIQTSSSQIQTTLSENSIPSSTTETIPPSPFPSQLEHISQQTEPQASEEHQPYLQSTIPTHAANETVGNVTQGSSPVDFVEKDEKLLNQAEPPPSPIQTTDNQTQQPSQPQTHQSDTNRLDSLQSETTSPDSSQPNGPPVAHLVLIWLETPGQKEAIEKIANATRNFVGTIPGLESVIIGSPLTSARKEVDSSYDVALLMRFSSQKALTEYENHPIHLEVARKELAPLIFRIQVYDFIIQ